MRKAHWVILSLVALGVSITAALGRPPSRPRSVHQEVAQAAPQERDPEFPSYVALNFDATENQLTICSIENEAPESDLDVVVSRNTSTHTSDDRVSYYDRDIAEVGDPTGCESDTAYEVYNADRPVQCYMAPSSE